MSFVALNLHAAAPDTESGLVAEYFELESTPATFPTLPPERKPAFVRVEKQINYPSVDGDFYGIRISDDFYARWTGLLRVEKAGSYTFFTESDDGSRLAIDGSLAVDNGGTHGMVEKKGAVQLSAGEHEFKAEFFEAKIGAGCIISWQPPGGKKEPIPEKVLFHKKGSEAVAFDRAAWEKRPLQASKASPHSGGGSSKHDKLKEGPFLTGSIEAGYPAKGNFAMKGLAISLGDDATVCFDTETLRYAAAWTSGYLRLPGAREGIEGHPVVDGSPSFGTKKDSPGWAKNGNFADPRPKNIGPLPRDWAHYKGLYLDGEKVILSYSIGSCEVLELPAFDAQTQVFSRTFSVGASAVPLTMLAYELDGATASAESNTRLAVVEAQGSCIAACSVGAPAGTAWSVERGRALLKIPALSSPAQFTVKIWSGSKTQLPAFISQIDRTIPSYDFTGIAKRGGAPRWRASTPVSTRGTLGAEGGAYVVDTLTVPYQNPFNSYMRLTALDFFSDGRAAVSTFNGDVWIVSGIDAQLENLSWQRFATGLFQPLGLKIVNDIVYVLGRDQITRLHDLNGDGEADFYENFNNDCFVAAEYHEFALDLQTDTDGNFYYMKGCNLGSGGTPHNGCMLKVFKDGSKLEVFAHGFRAPNGMGIGPHNEITTGDNQGNWTPECPINWVKPGGFYGYVLDHYPDSKKGPRAAPLCWIPYNVDNSSGGQTWVTSDKWGPFNGHLLHTSYGKCALFEVLYEQVGGEAQGGIVKFPLQFLSGIMRPRFNPKDGQLYIAGMKGWQTDAGREGALQRVRYTGKAVHMPVELHATHTGLRITFANALNPASAEDTSNWSAEWFNIKYSGEYGSPELWVSDPKKKGREPLTIKSVKLQSDAKTVLLEIPGIKPVNNMIIKYKIKAADGTEIKQELDNTINRIP